MRNPTIEEKGLLIDFTSRELGDDLMEAKCSVESAHIGIIDNYMPDGPGYCGKAMIVVWSGGIDLLEAFMLTKDGITRAL